MKKDKEWLQRQAKQLKIGYECLHDDYYRACDEFIYYINQLEEPKITEEQAWLDGYTVEKEKLYTACFAPIGTRQGVYLYRESGSVKVGDNMVVYEKK